MLTLSKNSDVFSNVLTKDSEEFIVEASLIFSSKETWRALKIVHMILFYNVGL